MIINHNISAMNSNRQFSMNVREMNKNLEALSSGKRINKGADDAAGLAVSEKMRAQVRGLNQASKNIQDASSLVQTAEGHLKESNDVLQRIRELTVQAANGTYTDEDRSQITVELDEMLKELNRIHEDAKFNTVRLLDGKSLGLNSFGYAGAEQFQPANADNRTFLEPQDISLARNVNFNVEGGQSGRNGLVVQSGANTDERMFVQIDPFNTYALGITGVPQFQDGLEQRYNQIPTNDNASNNNNLSWREKSFYSQEVLDLDQAMYLESEITPPANGSTAINLLVPVKLGTGADGEATGNRLDITTTEKATESITVVDVALNKVNTQRADLGAFQNRLEKAQEGVEIASENLQSAESRISDADMAAEFVEFTKNQILAQSAATMTAQANMSSQLIMRILG